MNASCPARGHGRPFISKLDRYILGSSLIGAAVIGLIVFLASFGKSSTPLSPPVVSVGKIQAAMERWQLNQLSKTYVDQIILTSDPAFDLTDCNVTVTVTYDDATEQSVRRFFGHWKPNETRAIDFPFYARRIEKTVLWGTGLRRGRTVTLTGAWNWDR